MKFRKFLWFNGWFSRWTMFLPDKDGQVKRFIISYRDKTEDGDTGPWQLVELEKPWKSTLVFINPDLRLYGFMSNALQSFAHMNDAGKLAMESSLFPFFQSVILSYGKSGQAENRQIRVKRLMGEHEELLIESDFLKLP
ncbi:hypothetical protein [Roseivirga sp. E12]|uniref:hypothetical protein n=1 Tax=Roseivirga sp. E12 TaxID=2819237 RepID=UPI001ABCA015|nr:hypothetical protein [Roseivirga sp. E12]MBO3699051.1 hypothetical protein [Roseivirga sp. E12]